MATELIPSSFKCDCGEELDFSEGTVGEMKKMSKKKEAILGDGKHTILFLKGEPREIFCPKLGKCSITDFE